MERRYLADQVRYQRMNTEELRETFLLEDLFQPGKVVLYYTEADRGVVGSVVPLDKSHRLPAGKELAAKYFAERREIGVINIGANGTVTVNGKSYHLKNRDGLYIGRGSEEILFESEDSKSPAKFYLLSYPAHQAYSSKKITKSDAEKVPLGSIELSNKRVIYKYIRPPIIESCQLVMGITELESGCIWNTMAPHTHERRTEIYMYFDLGDQLLFHFMGRPDQTRHLVVRDGQAVISPSWSIHAGAGTKNYTFIWGMGGENQEFGDMDGIDMEGLK